MITRIYMRAFLQRTHSDSYLPQQILLITLLARQRSLFISQVGNNWIKIALLINAGHRQSRAGIKAKTITTFLSHFLLIILLNYFLQKTKSKCRPKIRKVNAKIGCVSSSKVIRICKKK